jgi:hypothetical protein
MTDPVEPTDPNTDPKPQGDPADLGDAGEKALKAERKRANDAERNLRTLQTQYDAAVAEKQGFEDAKAAFEVSLADKDLTITKLNVGLSKGLPKALIGRLQGADEAALRGRRGRTDEAPGAQPHQPHAETGPVAGREEAGITPEAQFVSVMADLFTLTLTEGSNTHGRPLPRHLRRRSAAGGVEPDLAGHAGAVRCDACCDADPAARCGA